MSLLFVGSEFETSSDDEKLLFCSILFNSMSESFTTGSFLSIRTKSVEHTVRQVVVLELDISLVQDNSELSEVFRESMGQGSIFITLDDSNGNVSITFSMEGDWLISTATFGLPFSLFSLFFLVLVSASVFVAFLIIFLELLFAPLLTSGLSVDFGVFFGDNDNDSFFLTEKRINCL